MDRQLIERYAAGGGSLVAAIGGLGRDELNAFPVPGTWSIQQIVLHLMDSDLVSADRMKRIASMENPLLMGFDETAYAQKLCYEHLDARVACEIFEKSRSLAAAMLRRLPDEAFSRTGIHNERGKITLKDLVVGAAEHLGHHLKFIRQKRELLGKPLR